MDFKSYRSYYLFSESVRTKQRSILDDESKIFLEAIVNTCRDRMSTIEKGVIVFRAQVGHVWRPIYQTNPETKEEMYVDDVPYPFSFDRMKPLVEGAQEGRANPKGIPYLYVASDKETAMAEVRPWLDSIMTVGELEIKRKLKILDFSLHHGKINFSIYFKQKPSKKEVNDAVWLEIDNAFSKPTKITETTSDYAPTQIISEFVKSEGYDGIAYKSSFGDGHNLVLFDTESADVVNCTVHQAAEIKYKFQELEEN
ncbi:MAG: hypothetical protein A6F71_06025 [Cycloclasticus sp. symbiont of Poecilosclerida sp. M]|nr:MAG: hypothetical protein A6F71_06025 [Cycloclasticus sp. symbiont of Poecilosclerida sp. M]